jgi:hypothetical protein
MRIRSADDIRTDRAADYRNAGFDPSMVVSPSRYCRCHIARFAGEYFALDPIVDRCGAERRVLDCAGPFRDVGTLGPARLSHHLRRCRFAESSAHRSATFGPAYESEQ